MTSKTAPWAAQRPQVFYRARKVKVSGTVYFSKTAILQLAYFIWFEYWI